MSEPLFFEEQEQTPLVIVISGPSCAGKDTVIQRMKERNLPFHFVITATTRQPREDEKHGVNYFFVSHDEFAGMIERDELLEYSIVYDDYKGIPKEQVRQALASGKDVVMRVDVQGAAKIRQLYPDAILLFLATQDEEEMVRRLKARKSETPEGINKRISTARLEMKRIREFDYLVVNRDCQLDETVDSIIAIVRSEHHRVHPRKVSI